MSYEKSTLQQSTAQDLLSEGLIEDCPPDGEGCNAWIYRTVISLMASGLTDPDIEGVVSEVSSRTDKARLKEETARSLERARSYLSLDIAERLAVTRAKRPEVFFDFDCLRDQVSSDMNAEDTLESTSDECHNPKEFLSMVFKEGEQACVLRGTRFKKDLFFSPRVQGRIPGSIFENMLSGPEGVFFLNNPVKGKRVNGSWRSKDCVTSFRHLVIECDHSEKDYPGITGAWLKYLITLPIPIKSIVTSGGKSIHALADLGTSTETEFDRVLNQLYEPLVMSGADPNSLTSVRLTRLPFSYRGKATQDLLYVKAQPKGDSIEEE